LPQLLNLQSSKALKREHLIKVPVTLQVYWRVVADRPIVAQDTYHTPLQPNYFYNPDHQTMAPKYTYINADVGCNTEIRQFAAGVLADPNHKKDRLGTRQDFSHGPVEDKRKKKEKKAADAAARKAVGGAKKKGGFCGLFGK
jgi:hypothetical protein